MKDESLFQLNTNTAFWESIFNNISIHFLYTDYLYIFISINLLLCFPHKDNLHKMIESIRPWPHHHVRLMGDHPEPKLVQLLHCLQMLYVLPETSEAVMATIFRYFELSTLDWILYVVHVILMLSDSHWPKLQTLSNLENLLQKIHILLCQSEKGQQIQG